MSKPTLPAFDPSDVSETNYTSYPEDLRGVNQNRWNRRLGDHAGIRNYGVNLTRIVPGGQSSSRHAHSHQDEFIYVLKGEAVLETNAGRQVLKAGMCAGFPAGASDGHHLQNRSGRDAVVLEIGSRRTAEDDTFYPDIDMQYLRDKGGYVHRDGTPYPPR